MRVYDSLPGPHIVGSDETLELFGVITGDCTVEAGGDAELTGLVEGNLIVDGGSVRVNGRVSGDAQVRSGKLVVAGMIEGRILAAPGVNVRIERGAMVDGVQH